MGFRFIATIWGFCHLDLDSLLNIKGGGIGGSVGGLFWPQWVGLLMVLGSFERGTILTPWGGNLTLRVVWVWQAW